MVNNPNVCTIGHSNRPIEAFIDLLRQNGIECLLDVRGIVAEHIINPGKRRLHTLTKFARVDGTRILYPPEETGEEAGGAEGEGCC